MGGDPIVLHSLVGMAELRLHMGGKAEARVPELLAFVTQHQACSRQLTSEIRTRQNQFAHALAQATSRNGDSRVDQFRLADVVDAELAFGTTLQ